MGTRIRAAARGLKAWPAARARQALLVKPHPSVPASSDPAKFAEAVDAFRKRVPLTEGTYDELDAAEREFAFTVAGVAQADLVTDVWEALDRAIADGETLDDFKARVGDMLEEQWGGAAPARVETIFRTNVNAAYNEGRYAVFSAPAVKEARPFFRFDAIDDDRTDEDCAEANGTVLPQDDGFWDAHVPPLHPNCRCTLVALSDEEAADEGVTPDEPDSEAAEGFGGRPSTEGADWEPDTADYPDAIGAVLDDVLGR
jgi:SPP1 gp7 family putative phage head morphogenesis protein